jgi:hypothetical protein
MGKVFDLDKFKSEGPASPPGRRARQRTEPFVMVPWQWIERTAQAARSPATLVLMELLYAAWRSKSSTFKLPNVRLKQLGVTRKVKWCVLRDLESGGLITVERRARKTPTITLIGVYSVPWQA